MPLKQYLVLFIDYCFHTSFVFIHYITVTLDLVMAPNNGSNNSTGKEKIKFFRTKLELKKEINSKIDNTIRASDFTAKYNMANDDFHFTSAQ